MRHSIELKKEMMISGWCSLNVVNETLKHLVIGLMWLS